MSRRPAPGADRAAQNAQTIKSLLKLEGNKICADCKRNKHPRWASWNLGVFVCIRCSGIHRGMGTHISRVKSVDLDAWTDEQLQSVLKWGNSRANKYWEAKLAPGHMPSEAKIENFIRTKYESKRWVMEGPMPDPATLDADGDDDVPLNIVQEKAKMDVSTSQRISSAPQPSQLPQPRQTKPNIDLFGDEPAQPARPTSASILAPNPPSQTTTLPSKPSKPADSLFGIDFFGGSQPSNAGRPSSALSNPSNPNSNARGDLKSSILSLYASAPKTQAQPQSPHNRQPSSGTMGMNSQPTQRDAFGGLADAFGDLNFQSNTSNKAPAAQSSQSAFSAFGNMPNAIQSKSTPLAPQITSPPPLSGGNFFDNIPSKPTQPNITTKPALPPSNGLDFSFAQAPVLSPKPMMATSQDLFASDDFAGFASASPAPPPVPPPTKVSTPAMGNTSNIHSVFNLSSPTMPVSKPAAPISRAPVAVQSSSAMFDPWGSGGDSNAWNAPEPPAAKAAPASVQLGKPPSRITPNDISGGWGAPISSASKPSQTPTVMTDEDFGGWTSASTTQTPATGPAKSGGGFGTAPDPFDNPWG